MLLYRLERDLREIAGEGNLRGVVFELIKEASARGWLRDLLLAAREQNPENPEIRAICEELLLNHNDYS